MRPLMLSQFGPERATVRCWNNLAFPAKTEDEMFNQTRHGMSEDFLGSVLGLYELPPSRLAGGVGTMMCAFLKNQPALRGVVMDLNMKVMCVGKERSEIEWPQTGPHDPNNHTELRD